MDLKSAMKYALEAQSVSRQVLLKYFGKLEKVEKKHLAGLVSEADQESELAIINALKPFGVPVTGEEGSYQVDDKELFNTGQTRWLIDPLDGTTNYVHGFPIFCSSIALQVDGDVMVGVIDVPILNKVYTSIKGEGAFCNSKQLNVSATDQLSDALASTGFFSENAEALDRQIKIFSQIVKICRGMRRPGAAAFDLCMVAEGVFDLFWEENLKPWDTAAGMLLVREAGGAVTDYSNNLFVPESKNILATNSKVHSKILSYF